MTRRPTLPPFVKLLPLVVVGILLGRVLELSVVVTAIGAAICFGCGVLWSSKWVGTLYIATGVILTAMTTTSLRTTPTDLPYDQAIESRAKVLSAPISRGRWNEVDAKLTYNNKSYKVLLRIDSALTTPAIGQIGRLTTMVRNLPGGSYGRLLYHRGYSSLCYTWQPDGWQAIGTDNGVALWAKRCQRWMVEQIDRLELETDNAAVIKAMAVGWRSSMGRQLRDDYSRSGCAHLLAISGLHVGIVAMLVWAMLWFLPLVSRRGHIWRNVIAMVVMLLYAVITGMSPSVMRATLMFCTAQLALAIGGNRSSFGALCSSLTLMLLVNPNNLFDISFQLSALAVGGIMLGYNPLMERLKSSIGPLNSLWSTVAIGLCAMVATLPLVAHTFGVVGLIGVVTNPIVLLTANIIVLGTMIWVVCPIEPLISVARWVIGGCAELQNRCVGAAAQMEWFVIESKPPMWLVLLCYGVMLAVIVGAHFYKEKKLWSIKR